MGSHKSFSNGNGNGNGTLDVSVTKKFGQRVQKKVVSLPSPLTVNKRSSPRLRGKRPYYGPPRNHNSLSTELHENDNDTIRASHRNLSTELHENDNDTIRASHRNLSTELHENDNDTIRASHRNLSTELHENDNDTIRASHRNLSTELHENDNDTIRASQINENASQGKSDIKTSCWLAIQKKYLDSYVPHTRNDISRVKKTLRIYNKYYLHFFQEHNACENNGKWRAKHLDLKKDGVRSIKRPDMKAISKAHRRFFDITILENIFYIQLAQGPTEIIYKGLQKTDRGIDVGYQFYSRAEMVALGLHSHWLNDIDYMGQSYSKMEEFKGCTFPLAVTIILSGQNKDDLDYSEDIVYTGEGGDNFMGNKHQEMLCGNLALKNSMEQSIPVRVVRGHTGGHHSFRLYTYDGLYKVSECWSAEGFSGFVADRYRLKRLDGQPKLTSNQVQYSNGRSSRVPIRSPQLVCVDIAEGQEDVYIPAINTIDDATITCFTYTKYNQVATNLKLPPTAGGCECKGNCTNPKTCACARLNGFDFPYVRSNGGRLIEPKDVVFECGPNCGCGPGCINRVSQRGIKYQLEVFRTSNRGWAVKTKNFIPSGAPVCEYIGEVRRTNELENVAENDYIFEIDCWQTMKGIGGRERRLGDVSESVSNELDEKAEAEFCIDAGRVGNVARFINHSCDPNLFVQCVLSWHRDVKLARIVLFACDNIPPMQELTYDYGYEVDSVVDSNGSVRMLPCHCGTSDCRKRLY